MLKLDKRMIDSLLSMSDEKLTAVMRGMTAWLSHSGEVDSKRMAGIRGILSEMTDADLSRIAELILIYKSSKGGRRNG